MPIKKKTIMKKPVEAIKGVPDVVEIQKPAKAVVTEGTRRVGLSKGMTINMGDYESARVDYWMERIVPDNDREAEKAILEMSEIVENHLAEEVADLKPSKK